MTNFEKIKQMSAEEFADWVNCITEMCFYKGRGYIDCIDCPLEDLHVCNTSEIKHWLESEVNK